MQNNGRHPIPKRATAEQLPFHRAGHSSNIHPEDEPYLTDQRKRYSNPLDVADELDYPGEPTRMPSSAVRYYDRQGNPVIRRGDTQIVVHEGPPPRRRRRRPHWLLISGLSMIAILLFWWTLGVAINWVQNNQLNATYEYPRVYQADAVVYPGDTSLHPSHYLFLNLQGTVLVVELPHGDSAKARIYKGPTIFSDNADQIPVTGEFRVVNGKVEMLVHIQDKVILYVFNGKQFQPLGG